MRSIPAMAAFVFAVLIAVIGTHCVAAIDPVNISANLQAILNKHPLIPGMVAALVDHSKINMIGAAGVRKIGDPALMTIDDQIHLGSCTKAMTAVLIGQLIEQNKLSVNTPMSSIWPELAAQFDTQMAKVTVAQLLQHTAGLPANLQWSKFAGLHRDLTAQRRAAMLEALSKPPAHPPGTFYEYSNTGFVVLGAIVEKLTGKSWERRIDSDLFTPLQMKSAGLGPPGDAGAVMEPWGHIVDGNENLVPSQNDNPPVMDPAGRVHCTIVDWAKFVSRFESDQELPGVSAKTLDAILTPGSTNPAYGGGWINTSRAWAGGPVLTHAGSNTLWYCVAWVAPKKHFAALVAVNVGGNDAAAACDRAAELLINLATARH